MRRPSTATRPRRTGAAAAILITLAVVPTAAGRAAAPTMSAPISATVGSRIQVTASGLRPGTYSVTLQPPSAPKGDFCTAVLGTAHRRATSVTLTVRIPARVRCYSGFPAAADGSVATRPGAYRLHVVVLSGLGRAAGDFSFLTRRLRIR